jgi:hypothetical protein
MHTLEYNFPTFTENNFKILHKLLNLLKYVLL